MLLIQLGIVLIYLLLGTTIAMATTIGRMKETNKFDFDIFEIMTLAFVYPFVFRKQVLGRGLGIFISHAANFKNRLSQDGFMNRPAGKVSKKMAKQTIRTRSRRTPAGTIISVNFNRKRKVKFNRYNPTKIALKYANAA